MIFKFRKGSYLKGDAQLVGERLTQIRKTRGQLTPHDVVQEASRESSALHSYFEWDDSKAAVEYRLSQARALVAAVVLIQSDDYEIKKPIRAFVNISYEDSNSYESVIEVMGNMELRERVLDSLEADMQRQKEKLETFTELAEIVDGIEIVQERVRKIRSRKGGESRQAL